MSINEVNNLIETPGLTPLAWIAIGLVIIIITLLIISVWLRRKIKSKTPTYDGEGGFIGYVKEARAQFVRAARRYPTAKHKVLRTEIDSLLIAYDQMVDKLSQDG